MKQEEKISERKMEKLQFQICLLTDTLRTSDQFLESASHKLSTVW